MKRRNDEDWSVNSTIRLQVEDAVIEQHLVAFVKNI